MYQKISTVVISAFVLVSPLTGGASAGPLRDNFLEAQELRASAMESYRAGDMDAALEGMKAILALRPGHPTYLLNVAALSAATGDMTESREDALAALQAYADLGMWADAAGSEDFALYKDDPLFQEIVAQLASNAAPVVSSDVAFTLDMQTGLTEGIAYDAKRDRFIISSISESALYSVDRGGNTEVLLSATRGNIWGGFMGIRYDPLRDGVWATYSAMVQVEGMPSELIGAAGYRLLDLGNNAIVGYFGAKKVEDNEHVYGDVLIGSDGIIYFTDSSSPGIHAANNTRGFIMAEDFVSLQGLAMTPDQSALIVADYPLGLLRVEFENDSVSRLPAPPNTNLRGIDGLYRYGNGLIGIQNGARPKRIIYIRMNDGWTEVMRVDVIEKAVAGWEEPTLGVIVDDEFYYIANSGWTISGSGPPSAEDLEKRGNVIVRRIDLTDLK